MASLTAFQDLAQFAVALAGFTGIVVVFREHGRDFHPADRFRVIHALSPSLLGCFVAMLPVAFDLFDFAPESTWRVTNAVLATIAGLISIGYVTRLTRLTPDGRALVSMPLAMLYNGVCLAVAASAATNALGLYRDAGPGIAFLGTLALLGCGAVVFARMVFVRPDAPSAAS